MMSDSQSSRPLLIRLTHPHPHPRHNHFLLPPSLRLQIWWCPLLADLSAKVACLHFLRRFEYVVALGPQLSRFLFPLSNVNL